MGNNNNNNNNNNNKFYFWTEYECFLIFLCLNFSFLSTFFTIIIIIIIIFYKNIILYLNFNDTHTFLMSWNRRYFSRNGWPALNNRIVQFSKCLIHCSLLIIKKSYSGLKFAHCRSVITFQAHINNVHISLTQLQNI